MRGSRHQCWWLAAVLLLAGLLAVGCGKKSASEKVAEGLMEKVLEQGGGDVDVDLGGGGSDVTVTTADGTTVMSETAEWPSDMFADVPQFSYGVVERVHRTTRDNDLSAVMVYFHDLAADGPEKYAKDLQNAGWEAQLSMSAGTGGMISAQKGDLALTLMYNNEDKTSVLNAYKVPNE